MSQIPDEINNTEDTLDVRNIIERVEWLESDDAKNTADWQDKEIEEFAEELKKLTAFLDELKGNGGDEQWRSDWYPLTLVHRDNFEDYAKEMAEEITPNFDELHWPFTCIDWEQAAKELEQDYSSFDFDGEEYLAR